MADYSHVADLEADGGGSPAPTVLGMVHTLHAKGGAHHEYLRILSPPPPSLYLCCVAGQPLKKKSKKGDLIDPSDSQVSTASASTVGSSKSYMTDKTDWFGFFPPDQERADQQGGRYSKEALKKEFGDVVCLPCVVSRQGPPKCFKWCPCPDAVGHSASSSGSASAHEDGLIRRSRARWAEIKKQKREGDFAWAV